MHGLTSGQVTSHGFIRAALLLTACVVATALLLLPMAIRHVGTGGLLGLVSAAAICLLSAYVSEGISCTLSRHGSHLTAMLFSMAVRFTPPLAVCLILAATGATGRQHLLFVVYLLAFYLVTLMAETWLAVKRVSIRSPNLNPQSR